MKLRMALVTCLLAIVLIPNLEAKGPSYSNAISGNPIALTWNWFHATYEMQMSEKNSLTIFGSFYTGNYWTAFGVGASYRWYLGFFKDGKNIIEGFSFGPRALISYWTWDNYYGYLGDNESHIGIGIGAEAAYKWVWGGFMVEPYVTYYIIGNNEYGDWGGVNVGYAW